MPSLMTHTYRSGPLLPNEPRVLDWVHEHELTERYLMPAMDSLRVFFLELRAGLDLELSRAQPIKLGKPYPLGQCLEISQAMERRLQQLERLMPIGVAALGHAALSAFVRHGGSVRQVWGDLRGEYFQNAFLLGTLYVDVSNDTVFRTKPKVEILPFNEARFSPVKDFRHFARVASSYWKAQVFANHILPSLAPYFPLIVAIPGGSVRLEASSSYMFAMTRNQGFRPSEAILDSVPMGDELFQLLSQCLVGSALDKAHDAAEGKRRALQNCQRYRQSVPLDHDQCLGVINAMREANNRFLVLKVGHG